jgi:hypothetical protein
MTTIFLLAEEHGVPAFLQPAEVVSLKDPRALMMYLSLFRVKMEETNKPPLQVSCLFMQFVFSFVHFAGH